MLEAESWKLMEGFSSKKLEAFSCKPVSCKPYSVNHELNAIVSYDVTGKWDLKSPKVKVADFCLFWIPWGEIGDPMKTDYRASDRGKLHNSEM